MLVYKLILTGFACRGNRFCYSSFIFANYNFTLSLKQGALPALERRAETAFGAPLTGV